jgi:hypothetical protein
LTDVAKRNLLASVDESPHSLKTVLAQLAERWGIPVSIASLKRLIS